MGKYNFLLVSIKPKNIFVVSFKSSDVLLVELTNKSHDSFLSLLKSISSSLRYAIVCSRLNSWYVTECSLVYPKELHIALKVI